MKTLKRVLGGLGLIILALAVTAGGLVGYTINRSFPQTSGTLKVPGLTGKVDVYRDGYGVPHIYADNPHDLFLAQGYVHAQERFYQMDFWRHQTSGRLSELYGDGTLDADKFLRTVGWWRVAEQEYSLLDADTRAVLDAYAEGVNAYIASRSAADLSLEYSILGLTGLSNYRPEPWSPVSVLAWAKAMAYNLQANLDEEIERAVLLQEIGAEKTADYEPLYPGDHPVIVPPLPSTGLDFETVSARIALLDGLLGPRTEGVGSNSWVIAGNRTATGTPILANDPHLGIQMPSIWYEIGGHCRAVTPDCPYDFYGVSFAGAPGIVIGHNNRVAWGLTFLAYDVQDLYIEKINPANANQYEVNGEWRDMTLVNETIKVKGGDDVPITVRYTRHGPIINDVYWDGAGVTVNGAQLGPGYGLALRWTALDAGTTIRALLKLNRAQNFEEFRNALRDWVVPPHNIIYADVDGNIGYQGPGFVPIRKNGDGLLPVPGWTDDYEWTGFVPFDELPYAFNPPEGYIATANNTVVGPDYPYLLSLQWDAGYRAERIVDMIEAQPQISMEYIQQMHGDAMNLGAQEVMPYLLAALDTFHAGKPGMAQAADALRHWDFQMRLDSRAAAIYMSFFNALLEDTFHDDLPEDYWPNGGGDNWLTLRQILAEPNSSWWDNNGTPSVETRDDILRQAFTEGYAALEERLGSGSETWKWGALHTATFANQTLGGPASPAPIRALFNRGPFSTPGGYSIVNNTGWNLARDDRETPGDPYAVGTLPSMRMIVDLGNLSNSLITHTAGQSGHAFHPHYIDLADDWRLVRYHPMLWNAADVQKQAQAHLTLAP